MTLTIQSPLTGGTVDAIPSKSVAHRMMICAAFSDGDTFLTCPQTNADIEATAACLTSLGASVTREEDGYRITPVSAVVRGAVLDCGESGSTLRFLLPVAAALGTEAHFVRHGRLAERPLSPLYEEMRAHGAALPADPVPDPLITGGRLRPGDYTLDGGVSSQFVSGLLLAMPLMDGTSTLTLSGRVESADYIRITLSVMRTFGVSVEVSDDLTHYTVHAGGYRTPGRVTVEGDWSNGALWLCAGAVGRAPVTVRGLDPSSAQGDRRILDILRAFGAEVRTDACGITVIPAPLHGITMDAAMIPDLVPVVSAVAAAAQGDTVIENIARLRLKESDRVAAVTELLSALGVQVTAEENTMTVRGGGEYRGARVSSARDHRMVMCALVAAQYVPGPIPVEHAEAIGKSYPGCFRDYAALGGQVREESRE